MIVPRRTHISLEEFTESHRDLDAKYHDAINMLATQFMLIVVLGLAVVGLTVALVMK